MQNDKLHIVQVPIADLKASEYNPRKHTKEQVDQLKQSIEKFGCVDPLVANGAEDRKNILIGE